MMIIVASMGFSIEEARLLMLKIATRTSLIQGSLKPRPRNLGRCRGFCRRDFWH